MGMLSYATLINGRKICILGGSGFVGTHLINHLYREGHQMRLLTRHPSRCKHLYVLTELLDIRKVDVIHDPAELARQFSGMEIVINLVGTLYEHEPGDFERVHVELVRNVVDACRVAGVHRLLHMSVLGASPTGLSKYHQSKGRGEALVQAAHDDDLQVTIFRPSIIFGCGDHLLTLFGKLLKSVPVFPLGSAQAKFQPIAVSDVARAYVVSLTNPATYGNTYDLCGPQAYTLKQLVEYVAKVLGLKRLIVPLNDTLSYLQAWAMELSPIKILSRDNYLSLKIDATCSRPFPEVFGFTPVSLEFEAPECLGVMPHLHPRDPAASIDKPLEPSSAVSSVPTSPPPSPTVPSL